MVETSIINMKTEQYKWYASIMRNHSLLSLTELQQQERLLERELDALETLIQEDKTPRNEIYQTTLFTVHPTHGNSDQSNDDIVEFYNFLNSEGGHTGGWPQWEHEKFLQLQKQCNNVP